MYDQNLLIFIFIPLLLEDFDPLEIINIWLATYVKYYINEWSCQSFNNNIFYNWMRLRN